MRSRGLPCLLAVATALIATFWTASAWLLNEDLEQQARGRGAAAAPVTDAAPVSPFAKPAPALEPTRATIAANSTAVVRESRPTVASGPPRGLTIFPPLNVPFGGSVAMDLFAEDANREVIIVPGSAVTTPAFGDEATHESQDTAVSSANADPLKRQ